MRLIIILLSLVTTSCELLIEKTEEIVSPSVIYEVSDVVEVLGSKNTTALRNLQADRDSDGLSDLEEVYYKTNPLLKDSDGDGLDDLDEVTVYKTNPRLKDTDGDGVQDHAEVNAGTDPNDANKFKKL